MGETDAQGGLTSVGLHSRLLSFVAMAVSESGTTNWVLWTLLASIPVFFFAWRSAGSGRYTQAVGLLLLAGFLLRLGPTLDPFLHMWDERYHALVAKNMMIDLLKPVLYKEHVVPYDELSWTEGHIWLHKPPFTLWCMAVSMKLFGVSVFAMRIPTLVASTAGIAICFGIVRRIFGRRAGFVSAFLYAIQGLVIEISSGRTATDHVDAMFAFLVPLAIYCYLRALEGRFWTWLLLSGTALGCAILSKWLTALVVVPVCFLLNYARSGKQPGKSLIGTSAQLLVAAIVSGPWVLYMVHRYPAIYAHEAAMRMAHITEVLDGQRGGALYYLERLRISYGELIYLPCIWFLTKLVRRRRSGSRWALVTWWIAFYVFFSCVATKMQGYVLPATIPVLAVAGVFWVVVERRSRQVERQRWLYWVVLVALLALPARYCIERLKPFDDLSKAAKQKADLEELIHSATGPVVLHGCQHQLEAMFYTECLAYERRLSQTEVDSVSRLGYVVLYSGK